jgi:transposase InsO family protein
MVVRGRRRVLADLELMGQILERAAREGVEWHPALGLFKTEEIERRGPWRGVTGVEMATLEWVSWYNGKRILEPIGDMPPVEYEEAYDRNQAALVTVAGVN